MKINKQQSIKIVAAGKLALTTSISSAAVGGLGKVDDSTSTALQHDQIGFPLEILRPPIIDEDLSLNTETGSKYDGHTSGILFSGDVNRALNRGNTPRIDFIVDNIQLSDNNPSMVFFAYSTLPGTPDQWQDLNLSGMGLDRNTVNIFAALQVDPISPLNVFTVSETQLGELVNHGDTLAVSLNLSRFSPSVFPDDNLYFQVVAVPFVNGTFAFADATVSEVDHYVIARARSGNGNNGNGNNGNNGNGNNGNNGNGNNGNNGTDDNTDIADGTATTTPGDNDTGSKVGDDGSVSGINDVDTGSKTSLR